MTIQLILLENTPGLGHIGDIVRVRPGYGRNYLLPQGKALAATEENRAVVEARRSELLKKQAQSLEQARERAQRLEVLTLVVYGKAGEDGRLHGSVGGAEIAAAAVAAGVSLLKSELRLPNGRLSTMETHEVEARLHAEVRVTLKVSVQAAE